VQDELPIPDHPEYMVFATYLGPLKYPIKVSALSDMVRCSQFCSILCHWAVC